MMTGRSRLAAQGALVGVLVTVPLAAIFFSAHRLFGWPMVPFDFFDWMARTLPGGLVTIGIETMNLVLQRLGLSVRDTAKLAEGVMAIAIFLGQGTAVSAIFFAAVEPHSEGSQNENQLGWILSGALGLPLMIISLGLSESGIGAIGILWEVAAFLGWGMTVARVRGWLQRLSTVAATNTGSTELTVEQISRREFLVKLGGTTAAITVVGAGLGLLGGNPGSRGTASIASVLTSGGGTGFPPSQLPNADAAVKPAPGTRLEYTPVDQHYRVDINLAPIPIDGASWMLSIHGLVDQPLQLTIDDLRAYEPMSQFVTLSCISNSLGGDLIGTTRWTGVSMEKILASAGLQDGAKYLLMTSEDGFYEVISIEAILKDDRIMLCYAWDDLPLTVAHGFPARIYIPDKYGMKQPKWLVEMEVINHYEEGFWVVRGWNEVARMQTTSVIDTVASDAMIDEGGEPLVSIGGIAHAGARGVQKVELQVDGGKWLEAQLRDPISDTTWVIWRYDWPYESGTHTFAVRAVDGTGTPQIERVTGTHPSGATGVYSVSKTL